MPDALFILYVRDQPAAAAFYRQVLDADPVLDVPGMTEFALTDSASLGLMPESGIRRLLPSMPDPAAASGTPRAELYLRVPDPEAALARATAAGATMLDGYRPRDWGDSVGYALDPDGHVLAVATATPSG